MSKLQNYVCGEWVAGSGKGQNLYNAVNGEIIAEASLGGIDIGEVLQYGRTIGGRILRKMTFHERGLMLKKLALFLYENKEKYYSISYQTGATRIDSWIDIEGGIGNLFAYASLRREFGNEAFYVDGEAAKISKNGTFIGQHIMVPKMGVAIHINAYNFPVWGMLEKIAVNLLAGVPAVVKPATVTSFLTEAVVKDIIASEILPKGSLQLLCGSARNLLDFVQNQDVVTFTGSAETGKMLKQHPQIINEAVPFNMEADSLNAAVLGEDVSEDSPEFELFVKEVHREMTVKCGQKCTAIRRIIVPADKVEAVQIALGKRLSKTLIGDPSLKEVRMGALAGQSQRQEVLEKLQALREGAEIVYGNIEKMEVVGADAQKGAFLSPILLLNNQPFKHTAVHNIEAFGPVSTIIPYHNIDEAIELANMGKGSLCCTIATADDQLAREFVLGAAPYHGRILVLNRESAVESTGHGSPMPLLVHGGPGRAGGGEEMGGKRGVMHYLQRTAVQGTPTSLTQITGVYQMGGKYLTPEKHLFRKHFEELKVGETVITHKRTVTEADIVNFANVSWDHFYAHTDHTSLEGTLFERPVAHGYFILSAAAGLFVEPAKGPVLLNYGLESCRFVKPVYAGATIGVKLTVKEKIDQEKREGEPAKGIVKYLVEVYDETNETVAIATILTMVKKLEE
ncbi:MAG: phenylacetic acid degradation bifunctional protein PaaZ [Chitinophagales bacterium]|nr:phenylacetic acid degradation bifunctional protein PaaZ [Bacteroidota bacterium]MCB9043112.1 phenylacetic acid degradation bifunctional protein PaaZ [Chitinophagales bacterium]